MAYKKKFPRPTHVDVSTDEWSKFTAGRKTTRASMTTSESRTPRVSHEPPVPWKPHTHPKNLVKGADSTLIKRKFTI